MSSLRRVFLLVNAKHGFSTYDEMMLQDLDRRFSETAGLSFGYQIVLTKIDTLSTAADIIKAKDEVEQEAQKVTRAWTTSALVTSTQGRGFGIDKLREAIIQACN